MDVWDFLILGIAVVLVIGLLRAVKRANASAARMVEEQRQRMEALFRASFPELQPHFHPARVDEYVRGRIARKAPARGTTWKNPPGFPAAAAAEIVLDGLRDKVRLVDATGARLAEFVYEEHPEGGVVRYGKGKFTVNVKGPAPRVRYWHPDREFKWTPSTWKISSRLADQSLSSDTSSSSSDDYSPSSSSISRGAAAGAAAGGIIAAGGTFDGGGASAAWDDGGGGSGSSSGGGSSPDFGSVESGSSSSSSTSY